MRFNNYSFESNAVAITINGNEHLLLKLLINLISELVTTMRSEKYLYAKTKLRTLIGLVKKRSLNGSPSSSLGIALDSPNMWSICNSPTSSSKSPSIRTNHSNQFIQTHDDKSFLSTISVTPLKRPSSLKKRVTFGDDPPKPHCLDSKLRHERVNLLQMIFVS